MTWLKRGKRRTRLSRHLSLSLLADAMARAEEDQEGVTVLGPDDPRVRQEKRGDEKGGTA